MTYDVSMMPKNQLSFNLDELESYFLGRAGYTYKSDHMFYRNPLTGVNFRMNFKQQSLATVARLQFCLPYLRSKVFCKEAAIELSAFVAKFSPLVFDPQLNGMGNGPFDVDKFVEGWKLGNKFSHEALFGNLRVTPNSLNEKKYVANDKAIENAWDWNYNIDRLQTAISTSKIRYSHTIVKFAMFENRSAAVSSVVWNYPGSIIIPAFSDWVLFPFRVNENWLRFLKPSNEKFHYKAIPLETLALLPCAKLEKWENKEILMIKLEGDQSSEISTIESLFAKAPLYGLKVEDLFTPGQCLDYSTFTAAKRKAIMKKDQSTPKPQPLSANKSDVDFN